MTLIVNGIDIKDILVINSKTGALTELEKFVDTNGNIIWEKVAEEPATIGLVFSGIDANGNTQYKSTGTTSPYPFETNPEYNGTPVSYYVGYVNFVNGYYGHLAEYEEGLWGLDSSFDPLLENLIIPSTYNELPVVSIGVGALWLFKGTEHGFDTPNLKKIVINEGVKEVQLAGIRIVREKDFEMWLPESLENLYAYAEAVDSNNAQSITIASKSETVEIQAKCDVHLKSKALNLQIDSDSSGSSNKDYVSGLAATFYSSGFDTSIDWGTRTLFFEPSVEIIPILSTNSSSLISYLTPKRTSEIFDYYVIKPRTTPITFRTACMPQLLTYGRFVCEEKNKDLIIMPLAGDGSGIGYYKSAVSGTIYAENQTFYDYDWGTDNITPTFYKLDKTTLVTRIEQPTISLSDSILTITPLANATKYQIINGTNEVLATTTSTTIDLTQYTTSGTAYTLTVRAFADGLVSSIKSASVSYTAP